MQQPSDSQPDVQLDIKNKLEHDQKVVADYEETDDPDFPAWIFCTQDLLNAYGMCPHLAPETQSHRRQWLDSTHDKGQLFTSVKNRLVHKQNLLSLESQVESDRTALTEYVLATIQSADIDFEGNPIEYVASNIQKYKQTKHRKKSLRDEHQVVLQFVDKVLDVCGINLTKYLSIVLDITVRYRIPNTVTLDPQYELLCETFSQRQNQRQNELNYILKQRQDAVKRLAQCIDQGFALQQTGRYFKKWTLLTKEQQSERITSFALWYCRECGLSSDLTKVLQDFLLQSIGEKKLKVSSIKWTSKSGVIESIDGLSWNGQIFELASTATSRSKTKKVTFDSKAIDKEKGPAKIPSKRSVKKKLPHEDEARLNRLLLYHLVTVPMNGRSKEGIVKLVADAFTNNPTIKQRCLPYLLQMTDKMIEIIKTNPLPVN